MAKIIRADVAQLIRKNEALEMENEWLVAMLEYISMMTDVELPTEEELEEEFEEENEDEEVDDSEGLELEFNDEDSSEENSENGEEE